MRRNAVSFPLISLTVALHLCACSSTTSPQQVPSGGAAGTMTAVGGGGAGGVTSTPGGTTSGGMATAMGGSTPMGGSAGMSVGGNGGALNMGGAGGGSTSLTAGSGGMGGTPASGGSAGAGGTPGGGLGSLATVPIMVLGSSNEIGTCWRAFLWQKLQAANITNVDFVGGVTTGPDCGVPGYDKDLQAQNGNMVSDLTSADFAGWFTAHPPLIILEHFGGADILSGRPVDGVIAGFTLALQQARMVNPHVHFIAGLHTPQTADVQPLNAAAVMWAAQNTTPESPVTTVDLYSIIDPATDLPDGVHLNDMGSMKVATAWFDALQPLFE